MAERPLAGLQIALLESRRPADLIALLERRGGRVHSVPTVHEVALDASHQLAALLDGVAQGRITTLVALTGSAVSRLLAAAEAAALGRELRAALASLTVVCRGPKPAAVCKRERLPVTVQVAAPYTRAEVCAALAGLSLAGHGVAILHYGERDSTLAAEVRQLGAAPLDLCLYEWQLPSELAPLRDLVRTLAAGSLDVVVFTSQVQLRHLLQVAAELGHTEPVLAALRARARVLVAAVGPTCADALRAAGIEPAVVPTVPKSGQMVAALAAYVAQRRAAR